MSTHTRMRKQLNRQKGFTLIEIAIVLVIIGLLLGGVLKGQELINTARVRALNNSVDGITAAWFSFQDRYRSFPGDYLTARAVVNLPKVTAGGNGDGQVLTPAERGLAWVHLQAAGYITGGYTNNAASIADADLYVCSTVLCPDNGFGSGMVIAHGKVQYDSVAATVSAHELITGQGVPVDVLAELDRKVDDGVAGAGLMQIGLGGTTWTTAMAAACVSLVGTVNEYQLQTPSDNCAAVFRNF
ncbi:MAG: prepilin-type N-terminal cleavage/methylation domain-containing protein [Gammaproteobacteria bacterium]|nr:prepilin-type N-terminal cleavage/methylation domain-containing protein [Gammaproteobacteria bacterium]